MRSIVLIGGGGHARVVGEAALSASLPLLGFVDPVDCDETARRLGVPRLGDETALAGCTDALAVLGFGAVTDVAPRVSAVERLSALVAGWATVIHPSATVSASAVVGEGSVIMAGAIIQSGARIGAHCVVNTGALIDHDTVLEDHVQISPGAVLGGGVVVERGAYVGIGAVVRDHVRIGAHSLVAMGAAVVADVGPNQCVMGVPAR
jgi:sugar O-acyltransferase (sialic acid O-acetyltransferase NeuD family)